MIEFIASILMLAQVAPGAIPREVPYPLPPDFNECVRIVVKPEFREKAGKLPVLEPPLTSLDRKSIDRAHELDLGKIEFCEQQKS